MQLLIKKCIFTEIINKKIEDMKKLNYIFIVLFLFISAYSFADGITYQEAERVARNLYFEKAGVAQSEIIFEQVYTKQTKGNNDYFIFDVKGENGFVIVSADNNLSPIIGYSTNGIYLNENQPANIIYWMGTYSKQIQYTRENKIKPLSSITEKWNKYNVSYRNFKSSKSTRGVAALVDNIKWNQDGGWNDYCPADNDGPGGHVYAGCVATAMGIIMKYWEYPLHGTSSHSYYQYPYGTLSANFGNTSYFWSMMEDEGATDYSAKLLSHLGVAVEMDYAADGSGAYSVDVPGAIANYFGYPSAQYKSRSNYSTLNWTNLIKGQLDSGYPVYYSGRDDNNGGHAFVCSGYDDSDNFHFNFGWSGSNNGYYSLDDVGSFHNGQAAVINFHPPTTPNYPNPPINVIAELDKSNYSDFVVNTTWGAPSTRAVTEYKVYRDFDEIASVSSSTYSYTDNDATAASHDYSVRAIYSDGESFVAPSHLDGEFDITFNFVDGSGNSVNKVTATLTNNDTYTYDNYSSFLSFSKFTNVFWGGEYNVTIEHANYTTFDIDIDFVNRDAIYTVDMDSQSATSIKEKKFSYIKIYPNPSNGIVYVNIKETNNSTISIVDVTGKIVFVTNRLKVGKNILNLTTLNKGMYILKYTNNKQVTSQSIIIN